MTCAGSFVTLFLCVSLPYTSVGFAAELGELYAKELSAVKLFFYSNTLPTEIELEEGKPLEQYNRSRSLKLVIHGWNSDRNQIAIVPVRNAYLVQDRHNLLMADWSTVAGLSYGAARELTRPIGERIGSILAGFLHAMDIPVGRVHVVGHSLGAHIAGHVGRRFGGALARLTLLDPAGVLFSRLSVDAYNSGDAQFVDAIHTDGSVLGETIPRAHVDFYPNGGTGSQPGCELLDTLTLHACSHYRSTGFYAESILLPGNFLAQQCKVDRAVLPLVTVACTVAKNTAAESVPMGEFVSESARGTYYLETSNFPPYGLGNATFRRRGSPVAS
ncbi:pancreatic lipase-related protein 2-like isoform X1 [Culex pipiens pallens]|uniref:pancreatic lipase-related protein 2-like isoform X1 n=1 Tax=Culex pipiens pallens TaxID=42434 RepID=UPI001953EA93|nr:pancreatic lipase-related protein 2-like isoform X1 [Culex pipiens pallens]